MNKLSLSALLTLVVGLGACAQVTSTTTAATTDINTVLTKLSTISIVDLQAADADAKSHADTVASLCYEAVIPLVQKAAASPLAAPVGVVTAFQDLRDGINTTNAAQGLLKQLEVPCGPLAADVNMTLTSLVAQFAGAAVPGGGLVSGLLPKL